MVSREERWVAVQGFEGSYEVSDHGRIRTLDRQRRGNGGALRTIKGIVKVLGEDKYGYHQIGLWKNGKCTSRKVHQLVAEHFIGPWPEWASEVRHKDGVKTNNIWTNLAYATTKQNAADRVQHGTQIKGVTHPKSKVTENDVIEIRALKGVEKQSVTAARYGLKQAQVSSIQRLESWKHV